MIQQLIEWDDFGKVDIRSGTILDAKINQKARVPAYVLTVDFGDLGIKPARHNLRKIIRQKI